MKAELGNLLNNLPADTSSEIFEDVLKSENIHIERIISQGHTSPEKGWFNQDKNEWVLVLEGEGRLLYEDGSNFTLKKGDCLNIPANTNHKVIWTDPEIVTIWLAIHY